MYFFLKLKYHKNSEVMKCVTDFITENTTYYKTWQKRYFHPEVRIQLKTERY